LVVSLRWVPDKTDWPSDRTIGRNITLTYASVVKSLRVEVGSNISTVALRVARGDEKGTQCPEVITGPF
jgi:hypothetical protein